MSRRLIVLVTSLLLTGAGLAGAGASLAGFGSPSVVPAQGPVRPPGRMGQLLRGVNFISSCAFSHRAPDDPIVFPGQPGRSHDHSFVGNRGTNAFSTLETLLAGSTSCRNRPTDFAAYWMPTLLSGSQAIPPLGATIYYRRNTISAVAAFPPGLRVIAGNARATEAQDRRVTFWSCGARALVPPQSTIPTCPGGRGETLRLHVSFPSCWDGSSLDSTDHSSHMAYPQRGRCQSTHPVAVPAISIIYRYPTAGGPSLALASGGQLSGHADFFNAWDQATLQSLVERCLNALRHCAQGS